MSHVTSVGFTIVPRNRLAFQHAHEDNKKAVLNSARKYLDSQNIKWRFENDETVDALLAEGFRIATECSVSGKAGCSVTPVTGSAVFVVAPLPAEGSASWDRLSLPLALLLHVAEECPSFAYSSGVWGPGLLDSPSKPFTQNPFWHP